MKQKQVPIWAASIYEEYADAIENKRRAEFLFDCASTDEDINIANRELTIARLRLEAAYLRVKAAEKDGVRMTFNIFR